MSELEEYIYGSIVPRYADFDPAHRQDHALTVMNESMKLLDSMDRWISDNSDCDLLWRQEVDREMLLTAAACHDLGLVNGRDNHHMDSGLFIRNDTVLQRFFSDEQIEVIAQAAEDHRASAKHPPRSIYGMLIAEADRVIDQDVIILRTLQYGFQHYPDLDREGHKSRATAHLHEKYGRGGYLNLWVPWSDNAMRLSDLQDLISDDAALSSRIDIILDGYYSKL